MDNFISGTFGQLGDGKTLFLAYLACKAIEQGKTVYTNFGFKQGESLDRLFKLQELSKADIFVDDIVAYMDSRQSSKNVLATWALQAMRKKELNFNYSAQLYGGPDKRIRHITNGVITSTKLDFPYFRLDIRDRKGIQVREFVQKYEPKVYNSYDTGLVVSEKIAKTELLEVYDLSNQNKNMFKELASSYFNLPSSTASVLSDALKANNWPYIKKLFQYRGYALT
jgi:hypothetical protein